MENVNVKQLAEEFAAKHHLDASAVEVALLGVSSRVEHAIANGHPFSDELVSGAMQHWHESQQRYYQNLLDNKDGAMDVLCNTVYDELKKM